MAGLPIPDDWNETEDSYCMIGFMIPNSPAWKAMVKGAILNLGDEWRWDETTGNPVDAAETGFDIFDSYILSCP